MRILGHIHTFNDAEVIEQTVAALRRQTVPLAGILIVDNASTDDTLDRIVSAPVTIIRNPENLGTSGAVVVGFEYALANGFDWIWLFDADSVPQPDALENLFEGVLCAAACRAREGLLSGLPSCQRCRTSPDDFHRGRQTRRGLYSATIAAPAIARCGPARSIVWKRSERSGCHRQIISPIGENWNTATARGKGGFTSYVVRDSVLDHDVGGAPGISVRRCRLGPIAFQMFNTSPLRCYYFLRNAIIFWLYQCRRRSLRTVLRMMLVCVNFAMSFAVRPIARRRQLTACFRGVWDGLTMHLERRY